VALFALFGPFRTPPAGGARGGRAESEKKSDFHLQKVHFLAQIHEGKIPTTVYPRGGPKKWVSDPVSDPKVGFRTPCRIPKGGPFRPFPKVGDEKRQKRSFLHMTTIRHLRLTMYLWSFWFVLVYLSFVWWYSIRFLMHGIPCLFAFYRHYILYD